MQKNLVAVATEDIKKGDVIKAKLQDITPKSTSEESKQNEGKVWCSV